MGRYLVTGVAGFIASRVAYLLMAEGHAVVGVDNLDDAYDVRLKSWRLEQLKSHTRFQFHRQDICDGEALRRLFDNYQLSSTRSFDAVLNLAARAGVRQSVANPRCYVETNVGGTLNLLELCRDHSIGKFVLASSSSLYGDSRALPCQEDADTSHPLSPYAASKKAAETLCYTFHHLYGIDVAVLRYFTVYGPASRPDMSPFRFVQWIYEGRPVQINGDGLQTRDFTYVDDIARGTIASMRSGGYEVINLGSDRPVVLLDVVRHIERLVGREAHLEFRPAQQADVKGTWADIGRARAVLGWQPQVGYEEGFSNLVRWYRDNREWARDIVTGL
jgi:UDP-glucuronate 4-epimerase